MLYSAERIACQYESIVSSLPEKTLLNVKTEVALFKQYFYASSSHHDVIRFFKNVVKKKKRNIKLRSSIRKIVSSIFLVLEFQQRGSCYLDIVPVATYCGFSVRSLRNLTRKVAFANYIVLPNVFFNLSITALCQYHMTRFLDSIGNIEKKNFSRSRKKALKNAEHVRNPIFDAAQDVTGTDQSQNHSDEKILDSIFSNTTSAFAVSNVSKQVITASNERSNTLQWIDSVEIIATYLEKTNKTKITYRNKITIIAALFLIAAKISPNTKKIITAKAIADYFSVRLSTVYKKTKEVEQLLTQNKQLSNHSLRVYLKILSKEADENKPKIEARQKNDQNQDFPTDIDVGLY